MEHLRYLGVGLRAMIVVGIVVGLVLLLLGWHPPMPYWASPALVAVLLVIVAYVVGRFLAS